MRFDLGTIDWTALSAIVTALVMVFLGLQVWLQWLQHQRSTRVELNQRRALRRLIRGVIRRLGHANQMPVRFREDLSQGVVPDGLPAIPDVLTPDLSTHISQLREAALASTALSISESTHITLLLQIAEEWTTARRPTCLRTSTTGTGESWTRCGRA